MVLAMSMLEALKWLAYIIITVLVIFFSKFILVDYFIVILHLFILAVFVMLIPLNLNWSKAFYPSILRNLMFFIIFTIGSFSIIYMNTGIMVSEKLTHSFGDSLYFSLCMWTSLGYGEALPLEQYRILSSLESLIGLITLPLLTAFIWLYCQQRIRGKDLISEAEDYPIKFDTLYGTMSIQESPQKVKERTNSFRLKPCAVCSSKNQTIRRFYDGFGRLSPISNFVVICECGNMGKVKKNSYLAVWSWNRLNKIKKNKGDGF